MSLFTDGVFSDIASGGGGGAPSGPASGGLSGTFPGPDVVLAATQIAFGAAGNTLTSSAELTYSTTGVLDQVKALAGAVMSSKTRNTSNTASAGVSNIVEVAGTSATGDAVYQASVSGVRQFTWGIDVSVASQPFVFSVGTALGTTDVYSITSGGDIAIGAGVPVAGEKLRIRLAGDNDFGVESTATTSKATLKAICGANILRFVQNGSTQGGTTNGISNNSLGVMSVGAGSLMLTAPDSTSLLLFCVNGALKATINNQRLLLTNRLNQAKGADVASASTLTLGIDGDSFDITGTTAIDYITTTNWTAGARVVLQFDASVTVNHNTGSVPGSTAAIFLAGAANFAATANDTLSLWFDGTVWRETGRSVI